MQRHDQLLKHAYMCLNAVIPKMCMVKNWKHVSQFMLHHNV